MSNGQANKDSAPKSRAPGGEDEIPFAVPVETWEGDSPVVSIPPETKAPSGGVSRATASGGRRGRRLLWAVSLAVVGCAALGVFWWLQSSRPTDTPPENSPPTEIAWRTAERLRRKQQFREALRAYQRAGRESEYRDRVIERLLMLMLSDDPAIRERCRMALDEVSADWRNSGMAKAAVSRFARVASGPTGTQQRAAVGALQIIGSQDALPHLIRSLTVRDYELYRSTTLALNEIDPQWRRGDAARAAASALAEGLKHQDSKMRLTVAELLGQVGARSSIGPLAIARLDKIEDVRTAAGRALKQIDSQWERSGELAAMSDRLIRKMGELDKNVAPRAAELLGAIGGADLAGPLADAALWSTTEPERHSVSDWAKLCGAALAALLRLDSGWRKTDAVEKVVAACTAALNASLEYHDNSERKIAIQAGRDAARLLGTTGSRNAIPPLVDCLMSRDIDMRTTARKSLVSIDKNWAKSKEFEAKIPSIAVNYRRGADHTIALMRETGKQRYVEPLIRLLYTRSENKYLDVHAAIKTIKPDWASSKIAKRYIPQFIAGLQHNDMQIRENCAKHLGQLRDKRAIEPLIMALGDWQSSNTVYYAKSSLDTIEPGWRKSRAAKNCLKKFIRMLREDEDYLNRTGAAEALSIVRGPEAIEPLLEALQKDTSAKVRFWAMRTLADYESPRIVEVLRKLVDDEDEEVREEARELLAQKSKTDRFTYLLGLLASPRYYRRFSAVRTLARADKQWRKRKEIVDGLPGVIRQLTHTEYRMRAGAAFALGKIGDKQALAPLIKALNDSDPRVQQEVVDALAELGDQRAVAPLHSLRKISKNYDVKRRIHWALEKLPKNPSPP